MLVKKVGNYLIFLILIIMLCGCDSYQGKRPHDYYNTKWVCADPNISFVIGEWDVKSNSMPNINGQITINGETINFIVVFDHGTGITFFEDETKLNTIFYGFCKFSPDKLIVKIEDDPLNLIDDNIKEITFVKTAVENIS